MSGTRPLVYITAGEPSGDQLGARLMAGLTQELGGEVEFAGVGGTEMAAAGLDSLFPMEELAVMGLDFIPSARRILRRIRETVADVVARRPAALVTIDAQGYSARVGRAVRTRATLPIIQYGAPTVWAYRAGRAAKVAQYLDRVLCIFPFEPPYFERHGLAATFVGHPAAEARFLPAPDGADLGRRLGIPPDTPVLAALPGSRRGEVRRIAPVFRDVLRRLSNDLPGLQCVLPTVPSVADQVAAVADAWPCPVHVLREPTEKYAAFAAADAALATSGTVTVETAFAGLPTVVVYKNNPVVARVVRAIGLLKVDYASGVNLVLDKPALPEFIQWQAKPARVTAALRQLFDEGPARASMIADMAAAAEALQVGNERPQTVAAKAIVEEMTLYPRGRRAVATAPGSIGS